MEACSVLAAGHVFNSRYRIEGQLGAGGMGVVYRATQLSDGRICALKICYPPIYFGANAGRALRRFQREALLGMQVSHGGLVAVHDFAQLPDGTMYYTMECLSGCSLSRLQEQGCALPWPEAVEIALQAAAALRALHQQGIIHRDLKPANVQLLREGQVKVLDLGVAHAARGPVPNDDDLTDIVTQTGEVLGTPSYMAPEQLRDSSRVDPRTDVYALGLLLFELVTGQQPFRGKGVAEVVQLKFVARPLPPLRTYCPQAPAALEAAIQAAVAPHERRTRDMKAFAAPLEALLPQPRRRIRERLAQLIGQHTGSPISSTEAAALIEASEPPEPTGRSGGRRMAPWYAAGLALILIPGGLYRWMGPARDADEGRGAILPAPAALPASQPAPAEAPRPTPPAQPMQRSAGPQRQRTQREGRLRLEVRPFAEVYIDGTHRPEGAPHTYLLPAGRHLIRAVNPALGQDETRTVRVPPGGVVELAFDWSR
jgi:serine/threonine-protein kinase